MARLPESSTAPGPGAVRTLSAENLRFLERGAPEGQDLRGGSFDLPATLVEKVAARDPVLLVGAGISLAGGRGGRFQPNIKGSRLPIYRRRRRRRTTSLPSLGNTPGRTRKRVASWT